MCTHPLLPRRRLARDRLRLGFCSTVSLVGPPLIGLLRPGKSSSPTIDACLSLWREPVRNRPLELPDHSTVRRCRFTKEGAAVAWCSKHNVDLVGQFNWLWRSRHPNPAFQGKSGPSAWLPGPLCSLPSRKGTVVQRGAQIQSPARKRRNLLCKDVVLRALWSSYRRSWCRGSRWSRMIKRLLKHF